MIREAHLINYIRRNRAPQAPAPPAALAVEEQVVSDELGQASGQCVSIAEGFGGGSLSNKARNM